MPSDHPHLVFVQAAGYTRGRPDGPPLWIVVHDMEAGERSDTAENTARYFADPSDGRSVSAHYCWDNDSGVQCVRLHDSAWTVGNRPGNNRGINHEFAGFARQTREQWLDPFGLAMFRQAAPVIRADAARFGIPLSRRTVAELKAFKPGITSHNDLRLAFGGTTHTDPGPNFPWDVFLSIIREEEEDMGPDDPVPLPAAQYPELNGQTSSKFASQVGYNAARLVRLEAQMAQVLDLLAKITPLGPEALAAIATAVADEHHRRSAA